MYASFSHLPKADFLLASFYNPNIEPPNEWFSRAQSFLDVCELLCVNGEVVPHSISSELHEALFTKRCTFCYDLRLTEAAYGAKQRGFDTFTTTLLSSPNQNQSLLREKLTAIESELAMQVYYFEVPREEYMEKTRELKNMGIYVQNYCGCYGSLLEREAERFKPLWR
ncbi:MAG TPA: epoxyqueuosine reductase QueH [Coprothermobacter proteolyticus]|nr:epoxyqueuosine reductase QueH [Coprothermobacter proteolyticus]